MLMVAGPGQRTLICAPRYAGQQTNDQTVLLVQLITKTKHLA